MSAQAEAWTRKKPRRIIQNQGLIVFLMCIVVTGAIPFGGVIFWLAFGVCPNIVVPSLFVLWIFSAIIYIGFSVYSKVKGEE